ncbi:MULTISPECIES: type II toxin-antitoxin system Phd/YefM family antitoxin [Hyphobacterium]|uniref:Antitoxin n=1 Tax=Hyphobacterium vulgare TaxID=1736751 RepID=A0ABV7A0U1_9PROT
MRTFSAADAKNRFGELLDAAQREPVRIEKHGRATAVMVSEAEYADLAFQIAEIERFKIEKGLADLDAGRAVDGPAFFDDLKARLAQ